MVEFKALVSSNVNGMHYDAATQVLTIEFTGGSQYAYKGVPADVAEDLENDGSPGSFLNDSIKGVYPFTRVR